MAIFDIFGNPIVASGTGAGEIPDGSVTPAKTTFFNEYPTYRLIPLGRITGSAIWSPAAASTGTARTNTPRIIWSCRTERAGST